MISGREVCAAAAGKDGEAGEDGSDRDIDAEVVAPSRPLVGGPCGHAVSMLTGAAAAAAAGGRRGSARLLSLLARWLTDCAWSAALVPSHVNFFAARS